MNPPSHLVPSAAPRTRRRPPKAWAGPKTPLGAEPQVRVANQMFKMLVDAADERQAGCSGASVAEKEGGRREGGREGGRRIAEKEGRRKGGVWGGRDGEMGQVFAQLGES